MAPSIANIDRKSSMETEPRTLNIQQIQCARDSALYVIQTRSEEEAVQIFTEGLEPVVRMVPGSKTPPTRREDENINDRDFEGGIRDVFTAPF